jgi:signal transduction histidine kinase
MTAPTPRAAAGVRPLLAGVDRLETWLHVAFVGLAVASTWRYLDGHGLSDRGPWVLAGASALIALYAGYRLLPPPVWCAVLVLLWFGLTLVAPSFAWCAVPLAFVALRVLPFSVAAGVVAAMVVTVVAAWTSMTGRFDPTIVVGPIAVAVLAVIAYRALDRQAAERQRLLDELREAQGDLADAQHRAGVVAERARLSREIHDSVAQGLSSINLLLHAADQEWERRPVAAREHVGQAALTARDSLDEVRRVVRDLAPPELTDEADLLAAVRRSTEDATRGHPVQASVRVHGDPVPLPDPVATALLRTLRGALANVVEHAEASRVTVSLTYQPDTVSLDVRDDGHGFDPAALAGAAAGVRGRGLRGIRDRIEELGGDLVVESAAGEGTALAVTVPTAGRMDP